MVVIKRIEISNFKSFRSLELSLEPLNILIGANAAGKSNFIQLFKFLKHLSKDGLENAIYAQGGPDYFRNIYLKSSEPFSLKVHLEHPLKLFDATNRTMLLAHELIYALQLNFENEGKTYRVSSEKLTFLKLRNANDQTLINGYFTISIEDGHIITHDALETSITFSSESLILFSLEDRSDKSAPLIENPSLLSIYPSLSQILQKIATYDFDPKLPKKAITLPGKKELDENGHNLALILKDLAENPEEYNEFLRYLTEVIPYIERIEASNLSDQQLYLQSFETRQPTKPIPGSLLSDGTINITAIILALYFEKKSVMVLEEPERNIHPYLMASLIHMIKDASEHKQIFITTHHPEIVKHANIDELMLVSRDSNGFSTISKPSENEEVKTFLKNEIGIEELYIQNFLNLDGD